MLEVPEEAPEKGPAEDPKDRLRRLTSDSEETPVQTPPEPSRSDLPTQPPVEFVSLASHLANEDEQGTTLGAQPSPQQDKPDPNNASSKDDLSSQERSLDQTPPSRQTSTGKTGSADPGKTPPNSPPALGTQNMPSLGGCMRSTWTLPACLPRLTGRLCAAPRHLRLGRLPPGLR